MIFESIWYQGHTPKAAHQLVQKILLEKKGAFPGSVRIARWLVKSCYSM